MTSKTQWDAEHQRRFKMKQRLVVVVKIWLMRLIRIGWRFDWMKIQWQDHYSIHGSQFIIFSDNRKPCFWLQGLCIANLAICYLYFYPQPVSITSQHCPHCIEEFQLAHTSFCKQTSTISQKAKCIKHVSYCPNKSDKYQIQRHYTHRK